MIEIVREIVTAGPSRGTIRTLSHFLQACSHTQIGGTTLRKYGVSRPVNVSWVAHAVLLSWSNPTSLAMDNAFLPLAEDHNEAAAEPIPADPGGAIYVGEAECPQCGRLGDRHTKDCPHNLGPRDGK